MSQARIPPQEEDPAGGDVPTHEEPLPDDHFVVQMGVSLEQSTEAVHGTARLEPSMWAKGTRRPRLAVLATMVDVVAGHVPDGPRTPTIDLRIQATGEVPEQGTMQLVARPWRVGRKLIVSETMLEDERGQVFARATATFMNRPIPSRSFGASPSGRGLIESFDDTIGARIVDDRSLELDPAARLSNGSVGTVQGGVQALLAERAAEHASRGGFEAVDLDIRYLSRAEVGPLRAIATSVGRTGLLEAFRVDLVDVGLGDRLVSTASILSNAAGGTGAG